LKKRVITIAQKSALILALVGLSSCAGLRKSSPESLPSKPTETKADALSTKLDSARFEPAQFGMKARAVLMQGDRETRFRIEIRIERGRRIWVNVSDPVLGISVARLLLSPDSAAMYNRLDKTYLAGSPEALSRSLGLRFSYREIEDLLLVNLPFSKSKQAWLEGPDGNWALDSTRSKTRVLESGLVWKNARVDATLLRPLNLGFALQQPPVALDCSFSKETVPGDRRFPLKIEYRMGLPYRTALGLEIEEVETRVAGFPFAIPEGYRRVQ